MASLIDIRRRLRSIKNTQQITKAMKMVAAARLRRAQDRAIAARPYARLLREVLASGLERASRGSSTRCSRSARRSGSRSSSSPGDRGLAGAFNTNVNRAVAAAPRREDLGSRSRSLPIGKKAVDFWRRRKTPLAEKTYAGIFAKIEYAIAQEIADGLAARVRRRGGSTPSTSSSTSSSRSSRRSSASRSSSRSRAGRRPLAEAPRRGRRADLRAGPRDDPRADSPALPRVRDLPDPARVRGRGARGADDRDGLRVQERGRHDRLPDPDLQPRAAGAHHEGADRDRLGRRGARR